MSYSSRPGSNVQTDGGRFDFEDGGNYIGEWDGGRAHGLGLATGPDNQGEYTGMWTQGFESCGVYIWPSGNVYAGSWVKGKRHGEGIQIKGRWIYKGNFTTGFCGRYGVKESLTSQSKYEGSWHLNQFDGFGIETNSDGSTYAGAWSKGVRQGHGVRTSVPYGLASECNDDKVRASYSESSIASTQESTISTMAKYREQEQKRPDDLKNGFVLRDRLEQPVLAAKKGIFSKKLGLKKGIFSKLRKQKSTGDLTSVSSKFGRSGGSLRSNISMQSQYTNISLPFDNSGTSGPPINSQGDVIVIDPKVVECYRGMWNEDKRSGYGIAMRSDGLKYVGEWFNNLRDGYGVTHFTDGTKEEGRYKNNVLVSPLNKKNKLLILRNSRLKEYVEEAVRKAEDAAREAQEKSVETANQRAFTARTVAANAEAKAQEAREYSAVARRIAAEISPDFYQPGIEWERNRNMNISSRMNRSNDDDIYNNSTYSAFLPNSPDNLTTQTNSNLLEPVCLEVSGGSRKGSFRSSFRRRAEAQQSQQNNLYNDDISPPLYSEHQAMHAGAHSIQSASQQFNASHSSYNSSNTPNLPGDGDSVYDHYSNIYSNVDSVYAQPVSSTLKKPPLESNPSTETPDSGYSDVSSLSKASKSPRRKTLPNTPSTKPTKKIDQDSIIGSVENLPSNMDTSKFIIENGIRKRVQAERSAPKTVEIIESSLPEVSKRLAAREEINKLTRRLDYSRVQERKKQGTNQVGVLQDWIKNNAVVILVMVLNLGLVALFIFMLSSSQKTSTKR